MEIVFCFALPLPLPPSPSIVWIFTILGASLEECGYQVTTKLHFPLGALCTRNRNESVLGSKNIYFPFPLAEISRSDGSTFLPLRLPCWPFLGWITGEHQRQMEEEVWGEGTFPSPLTRTAEEQGRGWKNRNKISYFYLNLTLVITFKIKSLSTQIFLPFLKIFFKYWIVFIFHVTICHLMILPSFSQLSSPAPFDLQGLVRSEPPWKVWLASVPAWPPCCLVPFKTWASNLHDSVSQTCSHRKFTGCFEGSCTGTKFMAFP